MRLYLLSLVLLASCGRSEPAAKPPESFCRERSFEGSRFTVCDSNGGRLMLFAADRREQPLRSFSALMGKVDVARIAFAMNAGMFDENGRPIGLAIADRQLVHGINLNEGPGNFHLKPNGVFSVTPMGKARIVPSERWSATDGANFELATQSGPLLVSAGKLHPRIDHDGSSRLMRNGVGVRAGHALFVIAETPVSLGKFARFFRDALKTPDALYLDGSVSSLWDPANGRQDSHSELGPIIVAFKPEGSKPGRAGRARP